MKKLFEQFKGMLVSYGDITGIVCGFSDSNFICATEQHPSYSFRKKDKEEFEILEQYKDPKYRYFYATEKTITTQSK